MATTTPNIGLTLPTGTEGWKRSVINGNFTILDTKIGAVGNTPLQTQINTLSSQIAHRIRFPLHETGKIDAFHLFHMVKAGAVVHAGFVAPVGRLVPVDMPEEQAVFAPAVVHIPLQVSGQRVVALAGEVRVAGPSDDFLHAPCNQRRLGDPAVGIRCGHMGNHAVRQLGIQQGKNRFLRKVFADDTDTIHSVDCINTHFSRRLIDYEIREYTAVGHETSNHPTWV